MKRRLVMMATRCASWPAFARPPGGLPSTSTRTGVHLFLLLAALSLHGHNATISNGENCDICSTESECVIRSGSMSTQRTCEAITNNKCKTIPVLPGAKDPLNSAPMFSKCLSNGEAAIGDTCYFFCDGQKTKIHTCLLYTSPSPRDQRGSRMPSSA